MLKRIVLAILIVSIPCSPLLFGEGEIDKFSLWDGTSGTRLRGANVYQRRVYPELDGPTFLGPGPFGPPYTQEDFDRLAAMGANYVNISAPGLFTEEEPYRLDPEAEANLDRLLAMIEKADMFAVITFRSGPGRSEFWAFFGEDYRSDPDEGWFSPSYYNNRLWGDPRAQEGWIRMWRYTAERYRGNPIVVGYDLMCEPNANEVGSYPLGGALDIWDPDEFYTRYGGTTYDWNTLFPRIISAIREVDSDTPILVGGMAYSAIDWLPYTEPVDDRRTVYTVHQYAPFAYTHQAPADLANTYPGTFDADWDGIAERVDREWLDELLGTVDRFRSEHGVPVAVNEYGLMRWEPNGDRFMDDEMSLFEERGINYAIWLWESSWKEYEGEVDAFNFRHGPDPMNHADVETSRLIEVIRRYWSLNAVRPSDD